MKPLLLGYGAGGRWFVIRLDGGPRGPFVERLNGIARQAGIVGLSVDLLAEPPTEALVQRLADYLYSDNTVNEGRLTRHLTGFLARSEIPHRYDLRPGAPVEGRDLFGREDEREHLRGHLEAGRSVHLRAPRRYGKTTLLGAVREDLRGRGRACVVPDVSAARSVVDFLAEVAIEATRVETLRDALAALPLARGGFASPDISPSASKKAFAERIAGDVSRMARDLFGALASLRAVLLLDECSTALRFMLPRKRDEARMLCEMLSDARRSGAAMVLAGSSGLTKYVEFHGMTDLVRDLATVDLAPLPAAQGRVLLEELLYETGIRPGGEVLDACERCLGEPVPYFAHALVAALRAEFDRGTTEFTAEIVQVAYETRLLGAWGNTFFRVYRINEQDYPDQVRPGVEAMLNVIAKTKAGAEVEELRRAFAKHVPPALEGSHEAALACAQEDFDLVQTDGRYRMRCKVICDRWAMGEPWLAGE
ncbi:MAG: ATP-binding protein [Deltaproteobacteria bacterium]|nr:ATP-binding protein [Deltaproteobacteria bacterium]